MTFARIGRALETIPTGSFLALVVLSVVLACTPLDIEAQARVETRT